MAVDSEVIDYVAALARLSLATEERELLAEQLGRILAYVDQLREVDVTDVPPTRHVVDLVNFSREDAAGPSLPVDAALANAPESNRGYFVVPKVLPD